MRKTIVVILLLIACATTFAQPRLRQPEMYLGVQAGATASSVLFQPKVDYMKPLTKAIVLGANGGLVFRYSGQKCVGVQVELNYLQRGWREQNSELGIDYTRRLHYIELPFLTHIYFGKKLCRGFINLGPEIGYCFREQTSGTQNPLANKQYANIDNRFDWGVAGGLGLAFRTPKAGLYQLEARFNYGLGTIFSSKATDYFSQSNPIELSINLAWMWEFRNHKKQLIRRPTVQNIEQR